MSDPTDFTVRVRGDRDLIISKPEEGFEVTYRREVYYPMLIASDVLRNDFDESKVTLLAQAWTIALSKAKSLGWLDDPRQKREPAPRSQHQLAPSAQVPLPFACISRQDGKIFHFWATELSAE